RREAGETPSRHPRSPREWREGASPASLLPDHRPNAMIREQFDQQRMRNAAVDDVREADPLIDRVGAGLEFRDHPLADACVADPIAKLGGGEALDEAALIARIFEQAGDRSQIDDLLRLHRDSDRPRRLVGIDVVRLALGVGADGEITGVSPSSRRRWISSARTSVTLPTK